MMEVQKSGERVAQWRDFVAERLGREPRGFRDVAAFNAEVCQPVFVLAQLSTESLFPRFIG